MALLNASQQHGVTTAVHPSGRGRANSDESLVTGIKNKEMCRYVAYLPSACNPLVAWSHCGCPMLLVLLEGRRLQARMIAYRKQAQRSCLVSIRAVSTKGGELCGSLELAHSLPYIPAIPP